MKQLILCLCAALLFTGCASRLGYPAEKIPLPTEVTVRYDVINETPAIDNKLDVVMSDVWKNLYKKRIMNQFADLDTTLIFETVGVALEEQIKKHPRLFIRQGTIERVSLTKPAEKKPPKNHSGYTFTNQVNPVTTKYVLLYQLNEFGYRVTEQENGAYIDYSMLLVGSGDGMVEWKTKGVRFKQIPFSIKGPHGSVTAEMLMDFYLKMIQDSVDDIFKDLSE